MRNQCRLLLLRSYSRSQPHISTGSRPQVHSTSPVSSSLQSCFRRLYVPLYQHTSVRLFSSSEVAVEPPKDSSDHNHVVALTDIFSRNELSGEKVKLELEANSIVITHDLVLSALKNLHSAPDVASRFFSWISENEDEKKKLSSKSYNLMLSILGENGFIQEFWDTVFFMKKKGYGVSKRTFVKALDKFEKDGLSDDVEKLKDLYASGSIDNSIENLSSRVCRVIKQDVWGDNVEKRLNELDIEFSSELVSMVVQNIGLEGNKGLIFFRWVEESGHFKHNKCTYSAMARVLASEDSSVKFWRVVDEMRNSGYEMDKDTYIQILERFVKKRMIKDAVDLYEFATMGSASKPSPGDCTYLLKKIVVSKELDMDLFLRVVRISRENGLILTNSTFNAVLKSLTSVGRFEECLKILQAVKDDFQPNSSMQSRIAFQLSRSGKSEEANVFTEVMEAAGNRTWSSLIDGYCLAGDLEKASTTYWKMVEKVGAHGTEYALELLVSSYCRKNRAVDGYNLVSRLVNEYQLRPWHSTYKILIGMLLVQGGFKEALDILPLMKNQGYPPFLEPFIEFLSKSGSTDDAIRFTKAITVKSYPSTVVFLKLFEAYFKAGRYSEAQDFLLICPKYIRNHADVLNLFCSMNSGETAPPAATAAV